MNGIAVKTFPSGATYSGNFENGKAEGYGTYKWIDGRVYEGFWRADKQQGKGKLTFPNGEIYEGDWNNGKREGVGKLTKPNGYVYIGDWKNNKENGRGTVQIDEKTLIGIWKDGKRNGIALLTQKGKTALVLEYQNDVKKSSRPILGDGDPIQSLSPFLTTDELDVIRIQLQAKTIKELRNIKEKEWDSIQSISIITKNKIRDFIASEEDIKAKIQKSATVEG